MWGKRARIPFQNAAIAASEGFFQEEVLFQEFRKQSPLRNSGISSIIRGKRKSRPEGAKRPEKASSGGYCGLTGEA